MTYDGTSSAGTRISRLEYTVGSGGLPANGGQSFITMNHNLGVVPSVVVGHLEDGSFAHFVGWRVDARTATSLTIAFANRHPTAGANAVLRFRLIF